MRILTLPEHNSGFIGKPKPIINTNLHHSTFPEGYKGYGYIQLCERSKIYLKNDNQKTLISPAQLSSFSRPAGDSDGNYQKVGVWITPHNEDNFMINAAEVEVLTD
ncbi:hypothetical protein ACNSTQ_18585 [Alkalihalobacterium sp. APHAB7]